MKVLRVKNQEVELKEVEKTREGLQEAVGGYYEMLYRVPTLKERGILVVLDEDGCRKNAGVLSFLIVERETGLVLQPLYGTILFVRKAERGGLKNISPQDVKYIKSNTGEITMGEGSAAKKYACLYV